MPIPRLARFLPLVLALGPLAHSAEIATKEKPFVDYETGVTIPITCDQAGYENRMKNIGQFGKAARIAVAIPGIPAAILLTIGIQGGADPYVLGGGAALAGMTYVDYRLIKWGKKVRARHFDEVVRNLKEASDAAGGDAALRHTAELIDRMKPGYSFTTQQVQQALLGALAAGELCKEGRLVVTKEFRRVILNRLNQGPKPVAENGAEWVVAELAGESVD
jgi:hypothetical protein